MAARRPLQPGRASAAAAPASRPATASPSSWTTAPATTRCCGPRSAAGGWRFTCISSKLTAAEVEYIVSDSASKVLIASAGVGRDRVEARPAHRRREAFHGRWRAGPVRELRGRQSGHAGTPIADEAPARHALFLGKPPAGPKGASNGPEIRTNQPIDAPSPLAWSAPPSTGWTPTRSIFHPPPSYHAAPLGWSWGFRRWAAR